MNIPPAIVFINNDISMPPTVPIPDVVGADPSLYIGAEPSTDELSKIQNQLKIDETITKQEFDARVAADPNYPRIVHLQGLRVLVILETFQDVNNRNLADVVLFVKQGIAAIQKNKFDHDRDDHDRDCDGCRQHREHNRNRPPTLSLDLQRLNIYELLRFVHSKNVVIVPDFGERRCHRTGAFGCECDHCRRGNKLYKWIPENQPGRPP